MNICNEPPLVSVIVCSWNSNKAILGRTFEAINNQTLPSQKWELIVIDNNSVPPLSSRGFVIPANGRVVVEPKPGLTSARLCGIDHSSAQFIVFVDDDNILAADYLETALQISVNHLKLGVFGGRSLPEFEIAPPDWMKPFWANLALHDFDSDQWTNQKDFSCFPCGAGMCLRRELAEVWARRVKDDLLSLSLGRRGKSLASGEDTEIVLEALKAGWGVGRFKALALNHIIPKERLTLEYHCRLAHGIGVSIGQINGRDSQTNPRTLGGFLKGLSGVLLTRGPARKVRWAAFKGYRQGLRDGWLQRPSTQ